MWDATAVEEDGESEKDVKPTKDKGKQKANERSTRKRRLSSTNLDESSEGESKKSTTRRNGEDMSDGGRKTKKMRIADESGDHASDANDDGDEQVSTKKKRKAFMGSSDADETDSSPQRRRSRKRSSSPGPGLHFIEDESFSSAYVYRAVRQERVALGWSQAPCGKCPVFDFCKDKGPVNPQECAYFEGWLEGRVAGVE
jgi:DNA-directed RNA polymerase III subunit RPC6